MTKRLASGVLATALMRIANQQGGFAVLRNKGDAQAGGIILECLERGRNSGLFERILSLDDRYEWTQIKPQGAGGGECDDYMRRRIARDPDLWWIELDIPDAQRFVAELPRSP